VFLCPLQLILLVNVVRRRPRRLEAGFLSLFEGVARVEGYLSLMVLQRMPQNLPVGSRRWDIAAQEGISLLGNPLPANHKESRNYSSSKA
jgi:hypothetical protein